MNILGQTRLQQKKYNTMRYVAIAIQDKVKQRNKKLKINTEIKHPN